MPFAVTVARLRLGGLVERYRRIGLALAMKQARSVPGKQVADWPSAADPVSEAVLGGLPSTSGLASRPEVLTALVDDGADQLPRSASG